MRGGWALALLLIASPALAQEEPEQAPSDPALPAGHPPVGSPPSAPDSQLPAGHPPVGSPPSAPDSQLPAGHPPVAGQDAAPHGEMAGVLEEPQLARAEPSADVVAGTIRVTVTDENGRPVANAPVDVGVMAQAGARERRNARTGADGVASIEGLSTGSSQAYRVNVPYRGATYSSNPFQLPTDRGYDVRIVRLPVTREAQYVFFHLYRVIVEMRDERMHIIHQAELTNAGRETYVFPTRGLRARLAPGATAFQTQPVMSDQRIEAQGERAYVIRGSLPPGTVRLAWAYDVPVDGETMRVPVDVPMRFFGMQVFTEALPGLSLAVSQMPATERIDNEGQAYLLTQMRRGPQDPAIERVVLTVEGIPGPGPVRWIAVVFAFAFVVVGVVFAFVRRAEQSDAGRQARRRRREALLAEARELELDHEAGEIGPEFRQKRRAQIVRELAVLLHEEETAEKALEGSSVARGRRTAERSVERSGTTAR